MRAALLLGLAACSSVSSHVPVDYPVLLGPIDRIKGRPTPLEQSAQGFDGETVNGIYVCVATAYPVITVSRPESTLVHESIDAAFAEVAGKHPLSQLTARVDGIYAGAWVSFFVGCYGHKWWQRVEGLLQVTK